MDPTKTTPTRQDVEQLVAALFAVTSGLERARRQIPDAAALSVLQVLAWADRNQPAQQVRPKDIATALGVHRSAVTHQLQALEAAGQVSLSVDPAAVAAAEHQDLDELVEHQPVRDARVVAAQRVVDLAGGSRAVNWTHRGSRIDDGRAGTSPPDDHEVSEPGDHHGSCLPCSTPPYCAGP
jgi:MarR family